MTSRSYKSLKRIFKKAAQVIALCVLTPVVFYGTFALTFYNQSRGEKLTANETALVESIFGDDINAGKIRKHQKDSDHFTHILRGKKGTVMPFTSHIDFFGKAAHSKDYSQAELHLYSLFVHESTHTFQNQNGMNWKKLGQYGYTLSPDKKFGDYGVEEQADIIEDYAVRFLHPAHAPSRHCHGDPAAFYEQLKKVVEDRFPAAQKTRMKVEDAEKQQSTLCVSVPKINS
jgi:hypothetical protein